MNIEQFISENITKINEKITDFSSTNDTEYSDIDIKNYLSLKLKKSLINNNSYRQELINKFSNHDYVKARIKDIAIEEILYKPDLEKFYNEAIFKQVFSKIDLSSLNNSLILSINDSVDISDSEFKFIKTNFKKLIDKSLFISSKNGFSVNLENLEVGIRTAREGDACEFFFVARAILAGFDSSIVDVRSSG